MLTFEQTEKKLQSYQSFLIAKKNLLAELMALAEERNDYYNQMFPTSSLREIPITQHGTISDSTFKAADAVIQHYDVRMVNKQELINKTQAEMEKIETAIAVADLTGKEREYIALRYFENKRVKEIAADVGISVSGLALIKKIAIDKISLAMTD